MPIYEYECVKCGTFEATQRITEKSLSKCPVCKGRVKKLISNTSFQLKGTGWYVTDYARKEKAAAKSENVATSSPASETKSEAKKESPPAKTESSSTSTTTN